MPVRSTRGPGRKVVIAILVIFGVAIIAPILPTLLIIAGVVGVAVAMYVLVVGSLPLARLRTRRAGAGVLALAVAAFFIGGAASAATDATSTTPSAVGESSRTAATPQPFHAAQGPTATPTSTPTTVVTEVTETTVIEFERTTVDDPNLDAGTDVVTVPGANGEKQTVYRVTTVDGVETAREVVSETVTVEPVTEVTNHGTKEAAPAPPSNCHPSYADVCVPYASDVDCAGGSGDGPEYVRGPLRVVGPDVYDLDRDGDGIACDA